MKFRKAFEYDASRQLSDFDPGYTAGFESKKDTQEIFEAGILRLRELQARLYAQGRHGLLIILQAMDAAGKDGVIKHVMAGVNPQGCQVKSFKAPSGEELAHDFMWRCIKALPERGHIGIFNRSYYEEVLIVRVHHELLLRQNIPGLEPGKAPGPEFWQTRFTDIANFERYFSNNGFHVIKFFLNVSPQEQKKRFLSRIENPSKNWKFTMSDVDERQHWNDYMAAYQDMLQHTSKECAPWYVIPADKKWFMRTAVCQILVDHLEALNPEFPRVGPAHMKNIERGRELLMNEK